MAEAVVLVGTAIGAASLTIQLFEGALAGYKIFTNAKGFAKNAGVLQAQLLIQEQLFVKWGDSLNLTKGEDKIDDRLKTETSLFNAVVATLSSIKDAFLDIHALKTRYGIESTDELGDSGVPLSELASSMILHGETLAEVQKSRKEYLGETSRRLSKLKTLRWAVKDKAQFERLVALLTYLNDSLYSLVPPMDAKMLAKAIVAELLRTNDLVKLQNLQIAAEKSYSGLASSASLRRLSLTINRETSVLRSMSLSYSPEMLKIEGTWNGASQRSIGTYASPETTQSNSISADVAVLIEWKTIEKTLAREVRAIIESRVNNLANFLHHEKPEDLRALDCLGYIRRDDESDEHIRYGLIYTTPKLPNQRNLPISLYDLLQDDAGYEFDLGDKFKTAQMLAESIFELHISNWLHKGIRSENVLYFKRTNAFANQESRKISTASPFLAGYEFSRPGRLREITQKHGNSAADCYAHPVYRGGNVRYHRLFDIYSLGVVLLEIGLWRRIESGVSAEQAPEEVRKILVETCEDDLGPAMGTIYREAVRCCLQGDFPVDGLTLGEAAEPQWESMSEEEVAALEARDEQVNGDLAEAFYWKVVRTLANCRA